MANDFMQEKFEKIELFGKEGLFSNGRLREDDIPSGLYRYDLRGSDYDPGLPVTVENNVVVNHAASVLLAEELDLGEQGYLPLGEDGLNFLGEEITVQQFLDELNQRKNEQGIDSESYKISVEGHFGTWYVVDETEWNSEKFFLLESEEYGDEAACVAVNEKGKLVAEDLWNGFDEGFREAAKEYFSDKGVTVEESPTTQQAISEQVEAIEEEMAQNDSDVPVYYETYDYAKEHDEAELRWISRRLNVDCKIAIEQAIRDNFDGRHLNHDAAKSVLAQFGEERMAVVLANTLRQLNYDGRFSRANKEWAAGVTLPEDKISYDLILSSHPAILDGFVDLFREAVAEQAKQQEQENHLPPTSGSMEPEAALHGLSKNDIEETVLAYAQSEIDEMGLQDAVKLLGARVYGSRTREGLYTESSDVDVVLSYTGDIREDDFFNALHESGISVAGLMLDINPISADRNQTLDEYMKTAEAYLDERAVAQGQATFYVTEKSSDTSKNKMHEYDDIDVALRAYFSLPNNTTKILGVVNGGERPQEFYLIECDNGIDTPIMDFTMVEVWNNQKMSEIVEYINDVLAQRDIEVAYKIENGYLAMQTTAEGLDYTFYDAEYHALDGGVYDDPDMPFQEATKMLLEENNLTAENCTVISYADLQEKADEADRVVQAQIEAVQEKMKPAPNIKFYVAECAECPPCGIFYTCATLEEALALYDDLPEGRINGTRGLGFEIEHDSTVDGMVDILLDDEIQQDMFAKADPQGKNPLVQKAKADLERLMSARAEKQKAAQVQPEQKPKTKKRSDIEL